MARLKYTPATGTDAAVNLKGIGTPWWQLQVEDTSILARLKEASSLADV